MTIDKIKQRRKDMSIDITDINLSYRYSDSIANSRLQNIGEITYRRACEDAPAALAAQYDRTAFVDYFRTTGAWNDAEMVNWTDAEVMGLMLQFISGDHSEALLEQDVDAITDPDFDWDLYETYARGGTVPSTFYRDDNGRVHYDYQS